MYHAYVRRQLLKGMGRLNSRQYRAMLQEFPAQFSLYFPGITESRGPVYNLAETQTLYEQIFQIFPDLTFEVKDILVRGWPNYTRVAVKWGCRATAKDGAAYKNQGVHIFHIRWGKVTYLEIYCDTQNIAQVRAGLKKTDLSEVSKVAPSPAKTGKVL